MMDCKKAASARIAIGSILVLNCHMGRDIWRLGAMAAVLAAWLPLVAPGEAGAQTNELANLAGTLSVTPQPFFAGGALQGCTLVYSAVHQDWTYRKGALLKVDGNIGIMASSPEKLGATLKVVVNEVHFEGAKLTFSPSAPTRAYIVAPGFETNLSSLVSHGGSDTPGALFSVFQISPTFEMLLQGFETNELTIAFNSLGGSSDINMKLELDVADVKASGERVHSPKIESDFFTCIQSLVSGTKREQQ